MPEKLKRLNRLRESWAQRKKSTEYRIAAIATELTSASAQEEHLARGVDSGKGPLSLFPDLATRRLLAFDDEKKKLATKMDSAKVTHRHDSLNLRRCEIFQERHKLLLRQKDEAASLESTIEEFLQRKS
ncbi:MAG: hypothetical protein Q8L53_16320 [Aestuariivirga sp.]|nr:hypothetical protein [Aestuariivirga sp.]